MKSAVSSAAYRMASGRLFIPTLKRSTVGSGGTRPDNTPPITATPPDANPSTTKTAHSVSADLLTRAGFIRSAHSSGFYTLLPLALRVLDKVQTILHQELTRIQGQRVALPCLSSLAAWRKSGRVPVASNDSGSGKGVASANKEMFLLRDRKGAEYCLAPTHEEDITELVASHVSSHRHLPLRLYQIGTKFRDEARPRAGLLRVKEFLMKDLYTFDRTEGEAAQTYAQCRDAYGRIFNRIGVPFVSAEADTGAIGGFTSHEYHYLSSVGEDTLLSCSSCEYSSNVEKAEGRRVVNIGQAVATISAFVDDLSSILYPYTSAPHQEWKSLFTDVCSRKGVGLHIAVRTHPSPHDLIQPSHSVYFLFLAGAESTLNPIQLQKGHPEWKSVSFMPADQASTWDKVHALLGDCIQPPSLVFLHDTAGNEDEKGFDLHSLGHFISRKIPNASLYAGSYSNVRAGDLCVRCDTHTPLISSKSIEVGHTFLLGTKYSLPLDATFKDASATGGPSLPIQMGCYGIGVTRLLSAVVECCHDEKGIRWPKSIAPYTACIIPFGDRNVSASVDLLEAAVKLHERLLSAGIDVILDDREDVRPGGKMKDADLIGYPYTILVGRQYVESGGHLYEVQSRLPVASTPHGGGKKQDASRYLDEGAIRDLLLRDD